MSQRSCSSIQTLCHFVFTVATESFRRLGTEDVVDVAASVEAKDLKGFTPLLAAAADGRGDAVAVLLANKADASAQGQEEYHELTPAGGTDPAGPIRLRVEPSAESDAMR